MIPFFVIFPVFAIGFFVGYQMSSYDWRREAAERQAAHYYIDDDGFKAWEWLYPKKNRRK